MLVPAHFHLKNLSNADLLGLQLTFTPEKHLLQSCTITRERGSLTFEAPLSTVILGNLSPDEALDIYLLSSSDTFTLSPSEVLGLVTFDENYLDFQPTGNLTEILGISDNVFSDN